MHARLTDKKALVTGGATGIGLAIARRFAAEGARVAIASRDAQRMKSACQEIAPETLAIAADVSRCTDVDHIMAEIQRRFGSLDILVVNAGFAKCPPLRDIDEAFFEKMIGTNFKGAFFTVTRALPLLSRNASVILIGSVAHDRGRLGAPLYAATKAAIRSLARTLAADPEILSFGIRVNTISPGPIATPLTEHHRNDAGINRKIQGMVPLGRWGEAADVAAAAVFLASDESSFTTGANLAVDGGLGQI